MRLAEITDPLAPDIMREAFDLIYEYVTYGEIHDSKHVEHFEKSFEWLLTHLPRPKKGLTLYRAMRLSDEQAYKLKAGKNLRLNPRRFMSWTTSPDIAERIAWRKGRTGQPIIVTKNIDAKNIVMNVYQFYNTYGMKDESYFNYVRREREVIVLHDKPIILNKTNTQFLQRGKIIPPKIGDVVFLDDDENPYEIEAVPHYQPEEENGVFRVNARFIYEVEVRPIMVDGVQAEGEWEALD